MYMGNWDRDVKSGYGVEYLSDETIYSGMYYRNNRYGDGEIFFPSGQRIQGKFDRTEIKNASISNGEPINIIKTPKAEYICSFL